MSKNKIIMPLEANINQNNLAVTGSCKMVHRKVNPQTNSTATLCCKHITVSLASVTFKIIFQITEHKQRAVRKDPRAFQ